MSIETNQLAKKIMEKKFFGDDQFRNLQSKINEGYNTRKYIIFKYSDKPTPRININEKVLESAKSMNNAVLIDRPENVIIIEGKKVEESPINLITLTNIFKNNLSAEKHEFSFQEPRFKDKILNGGKRWYEKEVFAKRGVRYGMDLVTLNDGEGSPNGSMITSVNEKSVAEIILDRAVVKVNNAEIKINNISIEAKDTFGGKKVYVYPTPKGYKISKDPLNGDA